MTNKKREILVTAALPYANGALHLGHMVEYILPDIWVRFQKLKGHTCYYVCGSDAHGTPIMLAAEKKGINPEKMVADYHALHAKDLADFHIGLDNFYTTHSPENKALAFDIYRRLKASNDITQKTIHQAFDPVKNMFLPDRYVKGNCPKCNAADQYGDSCEVCGATYSPTDLKNPVSVLSGATPIEKTSEHFFFCLDHYADFLKTWTKQGHLQDEVSKKLDEWFKTGLQQWDITRDGPYFGFEIPDAPNKYFYVWLDAPIGYMASFKNFCDSKKISFDAFWSENSQTELHHFIGKDIVYFHALFWPAVLKSAGFRTPSNIFAHGFLTVNGQKMSKSRGTFIQARTYLDHLPAEYLRYYFATKLNGSIEDIDFQPEDFAQRINSDLVGKLVNIASRSAKFIEEYFDGKLSDSCAEPELYHSFVSMGESLDEHFEKGEYSKLIREIMMMADSANRYIDEKKPWALAKANDLPQTHLVASLGINLFRVLMTYLKPILPELALKVEKFLNQELTWEGRKQPLLGVSINPFQALLQRIDPKEIKAMMDASKESMGAPTPSAAVDANAPTVDTKTDTPGIKPIKPMINIEDFAKIDLRIAKIVNAESVIDADKLLKLTLDIGSETRTVFAGIKEGFAPDALIGKHTIMVANLAPRKMRFGISEGMVLVAVGKPGELWLLEPGDGATPGLPVQ